MENRKFSVFSLCISALPLLVSILAIYLSWIQGNADYEKAVLVQPGALPLTRINEGWTSLELEVTNTSKSNLQYFLRADSNMGCVNGKAERPVFFPCKYESQVIGLSNINAGKSTYKHTLNIEARHGAVDTPALAYMSPPEYFLAIEIIDASNGRLLYKSECFYSYHVNAGAFGLDQPVMDTTGESERRQKQCRP